MEDLIGHVVDSQKLTKKWAPNVSNLIHKLQNMAKKNLHNIDRQIIYRYGLYHDCGKPFCVTIDENGKRHFFEHEIVSYKKWIEYGGDEFIGTLILHDMDMHRMSINELSYTYDKLSETQWTILTISALAEVHSNAEMFGGIDSVNFKIKLKKVIKNIEFIIKKMENIILHK